jgi:hypothetical protein
MSAAKGTEIRWDARLVDRNLRKGGLAYAQQAEHLAKLPDVAAKAVTLDTDQMLADAHGAADRMRERLKSQPQDRRKPLPVPTTSFEDEEYGAITPEDEPEEEDEDE